MTDNFTCPHCGHDITDLVEAAFHAQRSAAGKAKTEKKLTAQRRNMAKLNESYTAEKRNAAAEKRRQTMAAKMAAREADKKASE